MKKKFLSFILICLFISMFSMFACSDDNASKDIGNVTFQEIDEIVEVSYGKVYYIPSITGVDSNGKEYLASKSVVNSENKNIALSNDSFVVDDINGYTISYAIGNNNVSYTIKVIDNIGPDICFNTKDYTFIYNKTQKEYKISTDIISVVDNFSKVKLSIAVYKDTLQIPVIDNKFSVAENGRYDVIFTATDSNGNSTNRTYYVYSSDCSINSFLDFEYDCDLNYIWDNTSPGSYMKKEIVSYDEAGVANTIDGGERLLKLQPITDARYPHYFFDLGTYMPAGTVINYKAYFKTRENPSSIFGLYVHNNESKNEIPYTALLEQNNWFNVSIRLTEPTRYISHYLHLAVLDGYDTPKYYYSQGIEFYIDNVEIQHYRYEIENFVDSINLKDFAGDYFYNVDELKSSLTDIYNNIVYDKVKLKIYKSKISEDNIVNLTKQNGKNGFVFSEGTYYFCFSDENEYAEQYIKTFEVFNRDLNIISNFEYVCDSDNISSLYQIGKQEIVAYNDLSIIKLTNGGDKCLKCTTITNLWPGIVINLGNALDEGTKVKVSFYVESSTYTDKIIVRDNNGDFIVSELSSGKWITIESTLTKSSSTLFFSLCLEYVDTKYYNINAIYFDNIEIVVEK